MVKRRYILLVGACCYAFAADVRAADLPRVNVELEADVESAYQAHGAIMDRRPFSAQYAAMTVDFDALGYVGGYAWSVSGMSRGGQSTAHRNFYNEVDYALYYGYKLKMADEWILDSRIQGQWATLPGFRPHYGTFGEVNVLQSFENPYVVPYYLYRSRQDRGLWNYWAVGLRRSWKLCEKWSLLTKVYGDFGDNHHSRAVYGANPNKWDGAYRSGLTALNVFLRLDYAWTKWMSLFVFLHQFDVVRSDARDALDHSSAIEATKDLLMAGVGITLIF